MKRESKPRFAHSGMRRAVLLPPYAPTSMLALRPVQVKVRTAQPPDVSVTSEAKGPAPLPAAVTAIRLCAHARQQAHAAKYMSRDESRRIYCPDTQLRCTFRHCKASKKCMHPCSPGATYSELAQLWWYQVACCLQPQQFQQLQQGAEQEDEEKSLFLKFSVGAGK